MRVLNTDKIYNLTMNLKCKTKHKENSTSFSFCPKRAEKGLKSGMGRGIVKVLSRMI
jgi:hypothetical protein